MFRNYFLINLVLILMISVLGFKFYDVATHRVELPSLSAVTKKQAKFDIIKPVERTVNEKAYDVISNLDLFRPSRTPVSTTEVKTEKAPDKNPPKLFGTIILNDLKTAILEDPDTKSTKNYRINDSIAGYVVSDILEDKVVLTRNGDSIEVKLREIKSVSAPQRPVINRTQQERPTPAVSRARRQPRPQRARRPVAPRQRRTVNAPPPSEELPDEGENIMENPQETEE